MIPRTLCNITCGLLFMVANGGLGQTPAANNNSDLTDKASSDSHFVPPLAVLLLVDKSSTAPRYMPITRHIVNEVINTMRPGDSIAICEFQESSVCLTRFVSDGAEVLEALETINGVAQSSANFLDALDMAMDRLENEADPESRRAIVLISNDGERFQSSRHSQAGLISRAQNSRIQIHFAEVTTAFASLTNHGGDSAAMRKEHLCFETGGKLSSFGDVESESNPSIQLADGDLQRMEEILDNIRRQAAPDLDDATSTEVIDPPASSSPTAATISADEMWKVVSWLPANTETLIVARSSVTLPDFTQKEDEKASYYKHMRDQMPPNEMAVAFQEELFMPFLSEALAPMLSRQTVVLAVRGLRRPRDSATGLGVMRSEGCLILLLEKDTLELDELSALVGSRPNISQEIISGRSMLVATEDGESVFAVHPRPNMLILATDRDYLQEVLARIAGQPGPRALPASLPEWGHVDTNAGFWAVRHYDRTHADDDPSSPLSQDEYQNERDHDDQAVGISFSLDPGGPAVLTFFTGNANFMARFECPWEEVEPEFKNIDVTARTLAPGVFQVAINVTDDHSVMYLLLGLGWFFGEGIEGL